jgi:hypothetical protein
MRVDLIDDDPDASPTPIERDVARFTPETQQGADAFSHAEIPPVFDQAEAIEDNTAVRHLLRRTAVRRSVSPASYANAAYNASIPPSAISSL